MRNVRWLVAIWPNNRPDLVDQLGMFDTKRDANDWIAIYRGTHDTKGFTMAIFKAMLVETEQ